MKISVKLQSFFYECVYELGNAFNYSLSAGFEYEDGFNRVMDILDVPEDKRGNILSGVFRFSDEAGIPYYKLSPLNQFIVTIPPYILYCLKNRLPDDTKLKEETIQLMNDVHFVRYLQEELGVKISQEIKGALWRPNFLGWAFGKLGRSRGRKDQQIIKIIEGLNTILKELFVILLDLYEKKFPSDDEQNNLQKAGVVVNELVLEELRGEQVTFKENNVDFINNERISVLKIEKIKMGVLSFLMAKGALYKSWDSPKADIWINGAQELEPSVIIPDKLNKIQEIIEKYLSYVSE